MNKCCYASNFKFNDWVSIEGGDDPFYVTVKDINDFNADKKTIICQVNSDGFRDYFDTNFEGEDTSNAAEIKTRKYLYARFWLCQQIGIPNIDVYINDHELIQYLDNQNNIVQGLVKDMKDKGYLFNNFQGSVNYGDAIISGGNITGQFGVCNNQTYKFQKFCKKAGGYILLVIIVIILVFIGLKGTGVLKKKQKTSKPKLLK